MNKTELLISECLRMPLALGYLKLQEHARAVESRLSERKTVHEWLNAKGTPREENGRPLCLLRRLAIALGIHDEMKQRPDSSGVWWCLRGKEWSIGRAEVIHWGDEDDGERVLAWTAGGVYARCDLINHPVDSGTRWAKAEPPNLNESNETSAAAGSERSAHE